MNFTYNEAVQISKNRKKLNFLKGDEALQFYRDKLKLDDAFRAENERNRDLSDRIVELSKERDKIKAKEDKEKKELSEKDLDRIAEINQEITGLGNEFTRLYTSEKEVDFTPIPWDKFKKAKLDDMETVSQFGKIIKE